MTTAHDAFWGAKFGMLDDAFGVTWSSPLDGRFEGVGLARRALAIAEPDPNSVCRDPLGRVTPATVAAATRCLDALRHEA